jgi:hypothetical protein
VPANGPPSSILANLALSLSSIVTAWLGTGLSGADRERERLSDRLANQSANTVAQSLSTLTTVQPSARARSSDRSAPAM